MLVTEMQLGNSIGGFEPDAVRQDNPAPGAPELQPQNAVGSVEIVKDPVSATEATVESKSGARKRTLHRRFCNHIRRPAFAILQPSSITQ